MDRGSRRWWQGEEPATEQALARPKAQRARRARFARRLGKPEHGMPSFMIRADVGTIDAIDSAVAGAADRLAEVFRDDPDPEATEPGETALTVADRRALGLWMLPSQAPRRSTAEPERPDRGGPG